LKKKSKKLSYFDCTEGRRDATGAYLVSNITPHDIGGWSVINESHFMKKESNMDYFFLSSALRLSLFLRISWYAGTHRDIFAPFIPIFFLIRII